MAKRRSDTRLVTCPCGKQFYATAKRIAAGRGKQCSKACRHKYATRRSGLKYEVKVWNRGWFRLGEAQSSGDAASGWKGDQVSYRGLHHWVRRTKPRPAACEHCGAVGPTEWANKSREYRRDLDDWLALCRRCHRRYDSGQHRGKATAKYGRKAIQQG